MLFEPEFKDPGVIATKPKVVYLRYMVNDNRLKFEAVVCTRDGKVCDTFNNMGHRLIFRSNKPHRSKQCSFKRLLNTFDTFVFESANPMVLSEEEEGLRERLENVTVCQRIDVLAPAVEVRSG